MAAALRWLRAEYHTKTEARQELGVRSIIDDAQFYDYLKLFAAFVRPGRLRRPARQHRRDGRALPPAEQRPGAERQLRVDPAHRQRLPSGQRLRDRLPVRRNRHLPGGSPARDGQLRGPRHPTGGERFRPRRSERFLGAGDPASEPLARGPLRPAAQHPERVRPRRPREAT